MREQGIVLEHHPNVALSGNHSNDIFAADPDGDENGEFAIFIFLLVNADRHATME